jgi:hypothetical protein
VSESECELEGVRTSAYPVPACSSRRSAAAAAVDSPLPSTATLQTERVTMFLARLPKRKVDSVSAALTALGDRHMIERGARVASQM